MYLIATCKCGKIIAATDEDMDDGYFRKDLRGYDVEIDRAKEPPQLQNCVCKKE